MVEAVAAAATRGISTSSVIRRGVVAPKNRPGAVVRRYSASRAAKEAAKDPKRAEPKRSAEGFSMVKEAVRARPGKLKRSLTMARDTTRSKIENGFGYLQAPKNALTS